MASQQRGSSNNNLLLKYAGLTMQLLVGLALAVWIGMKLDAWLAFSTPLFVWILPLLVITAMIYQIIKDTSKKN
ncbi:AtpZ/AtpI family protein [Segetibacter sp. 3557_3]|uniref:AtpZ/AtpI family protein n=1 Tax=Segetibacter sp. 3557_3 TaxID=2547429 RepID=UPI00397A3200